MSPNGITHRLERLGHHVTIAPGTDERPAPSPDDVARKHIVTLTSADLGRVAVAHLSPDEARTVAEALIFYADQADERNAGRSAGEDDLPSAHGTDSALDGAPPASPEEHP